MHVNTEKLQYPDDNPIHTQQNYYKPLLVSTVMLWIMIRITFTCLLLQYDIAQLC